MEADQSTKNETKLSANKSETNENKNVEKKESSNNQNALSVRKNKI